jgi:RNase P protein component
MIFVARPSCKGIPFQEMEKSVLSLAERSKILEAEDLCQEVL